MSTATEILYAGTWQSEAESEKGSKTTEPIPVKLKRTDLSKIPVKNDYVKHATDLSEYNYSRLASILLKQDSIQKFNAEFSITWLRDTLSDFRSFRITKNTPSKEIDAINLFLEELQFSELMSFLDCQGSEYTSDVSVYIRDHVLSFSVFNSYECGGAHPDFGATGHTFNMETGLEMELTDFLFFGKTEDDYLKDDSYKLGSEIMGPNIVKVLEKIYPKEMKKPKDEEDACDYSTPDVWNYTAWYLTEDGLYLYPYFSRAARNCDGAAFSTIPYKMLIKYKNPAKTIPMKY